MSRAAPDVSRRRYVRRALLLALAGGALLLAPAIRARLRDGWRSVTSAGETPYVVSPAPPGAPTLHFVVGWEGRRGEAREMARAVDRFYKTRLPGARILYYRYDDDVHGLIRRAAPCGPIVLAGFSYGGSKAVEACRQFAAEGRAVDHLVLLDPVQHANGAYSRPDAVDFVLPANVTEAVCYYRRAAAAPFSAPIRGTPATRYENYVCGAAHGDQVWDERPVAKLALALEGRPMVDPPAPRTRPVPGGSNSGGSD